jgi:hypothetical protein
MIQLLIRKYLFQGFTLLTAFACLLFADFQVYINNVSLLTLFMYLSSLILLAYFFVYKTIGKYHKQQSSLKIDLAIISILCVTHIISLLYFGSFQMHFMQDEFISAYTSFNLPALQAINWFQGFPNMNQWVSQFPILYFILQKPLLLLLGTSVEAIRISTWPYHIFTIIYLYLLTKHIFKNPSIAVISVLFYVFLAPTEYLESLGVHFISSTCFFLIAFYYLLITIETKSRVSSLLFGTFTALCYLTYASSYIALPVFMVIIFIETIVRKNFHFYSNLIPGFSFFLFILTPFVTYALFINNYFLERINEVSNTSNYIDLMKHPLANHGFEIFYQQQIVPNITALYQNGLVGVNDYWFGHLAPFTVISLCLLLIGITISLTKTLKSKMIYFYPILITGLSFIFGMVLTNPPGALHRLSIAFPFIAIIITIPLIPLLNLKLKGKMALLNHCLVLFIVCIFLISNINLGTTMVKNDATLSELTDSIYLTSYISANVKKGSLIYIAAFPAYHLEKELFFRLHSQYTLTTNYFSKLPYDSDNSLIIVQGPDINAIAQLKQQYPNAKTLIIPQLKHHLVFIPK